MNKGSNTTSDTTAGLTRRRMLQLGSGLTAAGLWPCLSAGSATLEGKAVRNGRIKQSIVQWCFELFGGKWNVEQTARVARELGCRGVELVAPQHYPTLQQYGLTCAIGSINMDPDPPFLKGFNNPAYWPQVVQATRQAIDAAAAHGVPSVICFTGTARGTSPSPRANRSQRRRRPPLRRGFKQVIGHAEKQKVTLCLEMLNTGTTPTR